MPSKQKHVKQHVAGISGFFPQSLEKRFHTSGLAVLISWLHQIGLDVQPAQIFHAKIETNNLNTVTFFSASSGREPPLFFSQEHSILENSYVCVCCTQYDYMFNRKVIELEK